MQGFAARQRFKKTTCPTCGAPKTRPSLTAYVYCDHCGSMADFDFQKACEVPLQQPGPMYEALHANLKPQLDWATARGDVDAFRNLQCQLFDSYVTFCPSSVPFRVRDPRYRMLYVRYMAEGAVVTAFDMVAKQHEAAVAQSVRGLSFFQPQPGVLRVHPQAFQLMCNAVFAQQEHTHQLNESRGVYALHPDGAPGPLQKRIGFSMFVQGWMPMLDEANVAELLARTGLKSEYVEAEVPVASDRASCTGCGAALAIFPGAKRVVCEQCGHRLEVGGERVRCTGCGSTLAPPEGQLQFACPHCRVPMQRMRMIPGR